MLSIIFICPINSLIGSELPLEKQNSLIRNFESHPLVPRTFSDKVKKMYHFSFLNTLYLYKLSQKKDKKYLHKL